MLRQSDIICFCGTGFVDHTFSYMISGSKSAQGQAKEASGFQVTNTLLFSEQNPCNSFQYLSFSFVTGFTWKVWP